VVKHENLEGSKTELGLEKTPGEKQTVQQRMVRARSSKTRLAMSNASVTPDHNSKQAEGDPNNVLEGMSLLVRRSQADVPPRFLKSTSGVLVVALVEMQPDIPTSCHSARGASTELVTLGAWKRTCRDRHFPI
jgi:hypothetical protein